MSRGGLKAFPVQSNEHYLTMLRYVERNPLRANMVKPETDGSKRARRTSLRRPDPEASSVDSPCQLSLDRS